MPRARNVPATRAQRNRNGLGRDVACIPVLLARVAASTRGQICCVDRSLDCTRQLFVAASENLNPASVDQTDVGLRNTRSRNRPTCAVRKISKGVPANGGYGVQLMHLNSLRGAAACEQRFRKLSTSTANQMSV